MSETARQTELIYEETRLLERLSWVEYLSDYDRIPERVLVNTGLAERLPFGRIRITDAGRVRHAALTVAKEHPAMTAARSDLMAAIRCVDEADLAYLMTCLNDSGRGRFWKNVVSTWRAALLSGAGTKSAPCFKASHNSGERDPSVMPDCRGADTKSDGRTRDSLPSGENEPVVTRACGPSDPSPGPDVAKALIHLAQLKSMAPKEFKAWHKYVDLAISALTRPLGGFVQGSIATKQSSSSTPATATETSIDALEPWRDELAEIVGHLGAAIIQSTTSDDQIIMDHVKAAHEIAKIVRRKA